MKSEKKYMNKMSLIKRQKPTKTKEKRYRNQEKEQTEILELRKTELKNSIENPPALLMEMQIGTTPMENSMEIPQKTIHRTTI